MKSQKICAVLLLSALISACMSGAHRPLTPEEQAMRQKVMQAFMAGMQGGVQQEYQPVQADKKEVAPARDAISKEELIAQIDALPEVNSGTSFERQRDGLKINGRVYLDPEGEIDDFGADNLTGDFTYIVNTGRNEDLIKFGKAGSDATVTLGYITRNGSGVNVETVTGKTLSGKEVIPGSRGFVVSREASAFRFDPSNGVTPFSSQEGFHIARFQNGDLASTNYILLEKDKEADTPDDSPIGAITGVWGALKDAGNAFGVIDSASYEYLLADMTSDAVVPLDVTLEGNNVADYSNCRAKNKFVNECESMQMRESLYRKDGSKNQGHYFWKVFWFNTPEGPFAIAQEAGLRKITITNLKSGEKVVAFERMLGINGFSVDQNANGVISIHAQLGFSSDSIDDAVSFFNKNLSLQASADS